MYINIFTFEFFSLFPFLAEPMPQGVQAAGSAKPCHRHQGMFQKKATTSLINIPTSIWQVSFQWSTALYEFLLVTHPTALPSRAVCKAKQCPSITNRRFKHLKDMWVAPHCAKSIDLGLDQHLLRAVANLYCLQSISMVVFEVMQQPHISEGACAQLLD